MTRLTTTLEELRRRLRWAVFWGTWSRHLLAALLVAGSAALLVRLVAGWEPGRAAWLLVPALATAGSAAWVARGRRWSVADAAAWLDVRAGGGGALVTALEVEDPRWTSRVEDALARAGGPPRWRLGPSFGRAASGAVFAAAALWVPVEAPATSRTTIDFDPSIAALREKLETLEEAIAFDEEDAAELERRLERIEEQARDTNNPEAVFEALAGLEERLEAEALEAREEAGTALEELAAAAQDLAATDSASAHEEMRNALADALASLDAAGLLPEDPAELADLFQQGLGEAGERTDWKELFEPGEMTDWGELLESELADLEGLDLAALQSLEGLSQELADALAQKMAELADAGLLDMPAVDWGELAQFDLSELAELSLAELADLELCEDCKSGEP